MSSLPLRFLLLTVAGWMTRDPQKVIAYLIAENTVLRERLSSKRIRYTILSDADWRSRRRSSGAGRCRSSTRW